MLCRRLIEETNCCWLDGSGKDSNANLLLLLPFVLVMDCVIQVFVARSRGGLLRLISGGRFAFSHNVKAFPQMSRYGYLCSNKTIVQEFSKVHSKQDRICQDVPSRSILLEKLGRALKKREMVEAWEAYKDFKRMYGFPDQFLMCNLITELSYSSDSRCIRRASDLVLSISKEKPALLTPDVMTKVAISLSRAQIPVPACTILRLMLEKSCLPSLDVLQMVLLHLVRTETGTHLASNFLEEICDRFLKLNANKSAQRELPKPDVTAFNLVLDACVRFETPLKGQQIMELMPQVGIAADAHSAVIIAQLHETTGMRDELKKFKVHIDSVPVNLVPHYQPFYDCLLSLHFRFNDIDGASSLLRDLCRCSESNPSQMGQRVSQKTYTVSIGSDNIMTGLKLQFLPLQLQRDAVCKVDCKQEVLMYKNGKFVLSKKGLAKLIIGYRRARRIDELSKLLIYIQSMLSLTEDSSSCSDVIDACIHLGWLETAHDILDDLESEKYSVREGSYKSLLVAYYNKHMIREAEGLVSQIRRIGLAVDFPEEMAVSLHSEKVEDKSSLDFKELSSACRSDLADSIIQNMREANRAVPSLLHEYNSSIYFFTKAKMMEDAQETYRKMLKMKIQPNVSTFFYLVSGYKSLGMYREITILWGDVKRSMESQNTVYHGDLYELVLLCFIWGGYFERVLEIIAFMMENNMFLDKWRYKTEFLKFHRDLYRTLTVSDAKDETQSRRIENVTSFRKWVGIR